MKSDSTFRATRRLAASLSILALTVGAVACGDDAAGAPDAAVARDGSLALDAGVFVGTGTCDTPRPVTGIEGVVTVTFDTTDSPDGTLDMGPDCSTAADPRPPQEVIAYTVPGTGPHSVLFTTAIPETLTNFDTVVQVRTSCADVPPTGFPPTCFDQTSATDPRSTGALSANGGDVVYFVVTGLADPATPDNIDRGPAGLEITARTNSAPVITAGSLRTADIRTEIEATGTDADGNAAGLSATFLDAAGEPVDLNGDRIVDDTLFTYFDAPPAAGESFTGVATIFVIGVRGAAALLAERLRAIGVRSARLRAFDEAFVLSAEEVTVPLRAVPEVGFGRVCDADYACYLGLRCSTAGTCEAEPAVAAACGAATALDIARPTVTTTSAMGSGTLTNEVGFTQGSCAHSPEVERIFDVTVPDMPVDLIATTDLAGSGTSDTVLYVRSICADVSTEVAGGCNDDVSGTNFRSRVVMRNMRPGTFAVFVEFAAHPPPGGAPFDLLVSLRPVLPTGASCDPMEVNNRCAVAACPAATSVCP